MSPHYMELIRVFGRIGLLSFGGPAAQIALMHQELVEKRPWLNEDQFLRGLSFCMLLPGPEAMQLATYTGWRLRGVAGGLIAGLLFVLPGACVIAALVALYMSFGQQPFVMSAFLGIKAAVVAIVFQALWRLQKKALTSARQILFALVGFVALFVFAVPFPLLILTMGLIGALLHRGAHSEPTPEPAQGFQANSFTIPLWAALWLLPLVALSLWGAPILATLGWFFAKLAVVSFGGAYAVLSYMTQTVVQQQGWISSGQMVDALGLAETTPGPLILVTQFVAMLSGAQNGGAWMGLWAGLVALWATFVPCFLWIFAAAPHVERLTTIPRLNAALKAITASVVGVILNLSIWFTINILFVNINTKITHLALPIPTWSSLNPTALILVVLAPILLRVLRGNVMYLLALMACLALGIELTNLT